MSIRQLPSARWTVPGTSGGIAANWYVYTYQPGTSTPKSTYTDYTGSVANSNPTVLDSRGEANIWWDGQYKVIVYTGDKDNGGVLVWSQDNYGEGTTSVLQGNFNLCLNGSFEQDTNGDSLPDNWSCVAYTTGTVALDSTTQAHGAKSIKFTSVGSGGGYATSDKFELGGSQTVPVSFYIISSAANVHNQVDVIWYTAAQAVISTTTLYNDSTTNPLTWTRESYNSTSPATARYAAIRIYGCKSDNANAGSAWFDGVSVESATALQAWFPNVNGTISSSDEDLSGIVGAGAAGATGASATPTQYKIPVANQTGGRLAWGWKPAFRGCLVYPSGSIVTHNNAVTLLTFDSESYDTDSMHDTVTNPGRVVIPSGVTMVRMYGQVCIGGSNSPGYRYAGILKNGTTNLYVGGGAVSYAPNGSASAATILQVSSPVVSVVAGDYFSLYAFQNSGGDVDVVASTNLPAGAGTWFAVEIIE